MAVSDKDGSLGILVMVWWEMSFPHELGLLMSSQQNIYREMG